MEKKLGQKNKRTKMTIKRKKTKKKEDERGKRSAESAKRGMEAKKVAVISSSSSENTRAYVVIGGITRVHYLFISLSRSLSPVHRCCFCITTISFISITRIIRIIRVIPFSSYYIFGHFLSLYLVFFAPVFRTSIRYIYSDVCWVVRGHTMHIFFFSFPHPLPFRLCLHLSFSIWFQFGMVRHQYFILFIYFFHAEASYWCVFAAVF